MSTFTRTGHYWSGLTLSVFIGFHLFNQLTALMGVGAHISVMQVLRLVYRHPVVETILLLAVVFQITTGLLMVFKRQQSTVAGKIQVYSGLYLSFFLLVHVGAVLYGRSLALDTNFYFAAAGLNMYPVTFFFIPYYLLAIGAVFLHVAAIHYRKTGSLRWSRAIVLAGLLAAILIISGFTNGFRWRPMPPANEQFIRQSFSA
ncbi:hypothetical protein SAMN04488128_103369 [Chitinophaga eiseniae]|uniref:Uncharacterized protein n=1 Tax=Chitinophaga eiseniae TaxID=634771 RepID=A0A1T4SRL3_9BACT|nr:hypothetical protein [Chitinophaga eiseniae]SKA30894.1 hypothetical protein SAMN04488128_103369 [Chitinophaga eiseniae]